MTNATAVATDEQLSKRRDGLEAENTRARTGLSQDTERLKALDAEYTEALKAVARGNAPESLSAGLKAESDRIQARIAGRNAILQENAGPTRELNEEIGRRVAAANRLKALQDVEALKVEGIELAHGIAATLTRLIVEDVRKLDELRLRLGGAEFTEGNGAQAASAITRELQEAHWEFHLKALLSSGWTEDPRLTFLNVGGPLKLTVRSLRPPPK